MKKVILALCLSAIILGCAPESKKEKYERNDVYSDNKTVMYGGDGHVSNEVTEIMFHAKIVGKMSCTDCLRSLDVYEFCYDGVKYFAIDGGYMSVKRDQTGRIELCE